jgi:hypothetical protein
MIESLLTGKWFNGTVEVSGGFCREAAVDYSPGLQPWVRQIETRALKVAPDVRRTRGINTVFPRRTRRPPLSGRVNASPNPGLKPWAVLYSPFGRSERAKKPNHEH